MQDGLLRLIWELEHNKNCSACSFVEGVLYGCSACSIVLGPFIVRGWPEKPILMAPGHDRGFGFLKNVAIDPHLTEAKRDYELINVVDAHPEILGIGLDEGAALIVQGNQFEVIGTEMAAIYDNKPHQGGWYYWLNPGDHFDLSKWQKSGQLQGRSFQLSSVYANRQTAFPTRLGLETSFALLATVDSSRLRKIPACWPTSGKKCAFFGAVYTQRPVYLGVGTLKQRDCFSGSILLKIGQSQHRLTHVHPRNS